MEEKKEGNQQKPVVVYGIVNIGCDQTGATFQTLVGAPQPAQAEDASAAEVELIDLKFFDDRKFGTMERQQKLRQVLQSIMPKMDADSGRDWVAVYIAYHFYMKRLLMTKRYADFFADIEHLLPGLLTKVKKEEPRGDKRYKSYTEALASECGYWFIMDGCLPEMAEWRSSRFCYQVDDNRRGRIQNLVKEIYQGLKDAEA